MGSDEKGDEAALGIENRVKFDGNVLLVKGAVSVGVEDGVEAGTAVEAENFILFDTRVFLEGEIGTFFLSGVSTGEFLSLMTCAYDGRDERVD